MKFKAAFLIISYMILTGCDGVKVPEADSLPLQQPTQTISPKKPLSEIDLSEIKHIRSKGRVQDGGLSDSNFNKLTIADDLIANGIDSIPFLIEKLDNETKLKDRPMNYWYEVYEGDVALVILSHLFRTKDAETSTIAGFSWDDFLERGNDKDSMSEEILRRYIKKHGRKNIKERWQKMWDENKDKIYWNETEKCFDIKK